MGENGPSEKAEQLREIVFQQVLQHGLPWRIESDWTEEVLAADGYCIAKCRSRERAESIVAVAETCIARTHAGPSSPEGETA